MSRSHKAIGDLALFGGQPAFAEELYVGRPNMGDRGRLLERINDILDHRWFTNGGKYVTEFEHRVAQIAGVRHCIAVCNGTVALEIVVRALGLTGEVILPSFTFIATAHALQWQGIRPVFCDIDPRTHNIDPEQIEPLITPRTTAIIGVHVWGRPCDTERLERLARTHHLRLLFDAAHAFACSHHGRMIGSFGDTEVYSFHATKFINTFEGGAIVTNDSDLAARIRLMKNFGFAGYDKVIYIGTNGKMTELSAAMGLTTLESLEEIVAVNRRNYELYRDGLTGLPGIELVAYDPTEKNNYQYVVVTVDSAALGVSRDDLVRILHAENVIARRYFYPGCHRMEPYRSLYRQDDSPLPRTEALSQSVLSLPTGTCVGPEEIGAICDILRLVVTHRDQARQHLAGHKSDSGLITRVVARPAPFAVRERRIRGESQRPDDHVQS